MRRRKKRGEGSGSDPDPERRLEDISEIREVGPPDSGVDDTELALIEQHEAEVALLKAPPSRPLERGTGLVLVALSLLGLYESQHIAIRNHVGSAFGPRWWPTALCVLALALSISLTVVAFTRPPFERDGIERSTREGWYKFGITLIVEASFIVSWALTGNFVITGALMLAVMLWVYGTRSWKMLIVFPVVTIALIYALFDLLLKIPL